MKTPPEISQSFARVRAEDVIDKATSAVQSIQAQRQREWEFEVHQKMKQRRHWLGRHYTREEAEEALKREDFISTYDMIFKFAYGKNMAQAVGLIKLAKATQRHGDGTIYLSTEDAALIAPNP